MSFLTEAAATLEYNTTDYTQEYNTKTVENFGEEFIKKEGSETVVSVSASDSLETRTATSGSYVQSSVISSASSATASTAASSFKMSTGGSLPPLTYTTTTTIPTIATQVSSSEESGVLYCNLDDLSRYIPDNFSFDQIIPENIGHDENVSVQVLSLPPSSQTPVHHQSNPKQMAISFPQHTDPRVAPGSSVQIQVNNILIHSSLNRKYNEVNIRRDNDN